VYVLRQNCRAAGWRWDSYKNLKILDLDNTLVVEIQKGILLYSCHIVRKFLNIDTEHNTQQSQNAEARRR
jgi:hypothetical protein